MEIHSRVEGRVQMVLFRDFVQRNALWLGLRGVVKNLPDGSVDVVAQGEEDKLNKMITLLHKGSLLSRVDAVAVLWREPSKDFQGFTIEYD